MRANTRGDFYFRTRPADGQTANGDEVVYRATEGGWMFAVIDALGHGPAAAEVAARARVFLERCDATRDAGSLLEEMHETLRGSRGAAATLCVTQGRSLSGCGVGNVELRCSDPRFALHASPGVLGGRVRRFRPLTVELRAGTRVVLHSDGISNRIASHELFSTLPAAVCELALERYAKPHDDATILVADFS